jgi:hypothetical protein
MLRFKLLIFTCLITVACQSVQAKQIVSTDTPIPPAVVEVAQNITSTPVPTINPVTNTPKPSATATFKPILTNTPRPTLRPTLTFTPTITLTLHLPIGRVIRITRQSPPGQRHHLTRLHRLPIITVCAGLLIALVSIGLTAHTRMVVHQAVVFRYIMGLSSLIHAVHLFWLPAMA